MLDFDLHALHAVLDAERRTRGLTWIDLTAEVNAPFKHTNSIPISIGTIRGMTEKRSVTSAVVLQILRWLDRTPESFLAGRDASIFGEKPLPAGPSRILRFDTYAIHAALDTERCRGGMTWQQLANALPGFTPDMLTNLATGPLIGFPRVMVLMQWLSRPASAFVRVRSE